jgi:ketosteroid isomerase-like protein
MKKIILLTAIVICTCLSCNSGNTNNEASLEKWKAEILDTEREFAEMAQKEGIPEAFLKYAAEDAVLLRNNKLIIGRKALRESYETQKPGATTISLNWKPDYVDVAASGDLGYTYGKYTYTSTDSTGTANVMEGIFHTVWKRQSDGRWQFVWD